MEVEDALDCAVCGQCPPDDPILTSCLCIYCMECFTEMLAKASEVGKSPSMPCAAYPDERIEYFVSLTAAHFESLSGIFDHHTEPVCTFGERSRCLQEDVELLWQSYLTGKADALGEGEHSRNSPELGEESMELSSDGFDGNSRSTGYEDDPGSDDTSQLEDEGEMSQHNVTTSEIEELEITVGGWELPGQPETVTSSLGNASNLGSHVDLTEDSDVDASAPFQGVTENKDSESGEDHDADEKVSDEADNVVEFSRGHDGLASECNCYDCVGPGYSPSPSA